MGLGQTVELLAQLGLAAVAAFLAILLWSTTRDTPWMFLVLGMIIKFTEVMVSTLELFGIIQSRLIIISGIEIGKVLLIGLPYVFFSIAFIIMILRNRVRYESVAEELQKKKERKRKKDKELPAPETNKP